MLEFLRNPLRRHFFPLIVYRWIYSLEGVSIAGLLHRLHYVLVDAEGDGPCEAQQRQIRYHADQREVCECQEDEEDASEDGSGLLGVSPIDQAFHCNTRRS